MTKFVSTQLFHTIVVRSKPPTEKIGICFQRPWLIKVDRSNYTMKRNKSILIPF